MGRFYPASEVSKFGYIQFSSVPQMIIELGTGNRDSWVTTIENTDRISGATYIEQAMRMGANDWETSGVLDSSKPQVTIILTDGNFF